MTNVNINPLFQKPYDLNLLISRPTKVLETKNIQTEQTSTSLFTGSGK